MVNVPHSGADVRPLVNRLALVVGVGRRCGWRPRWGGRGGGGASGGGGAARGGRGGGRGGPPAGVPRRTLVSGLLLGVGFAAFVDEAVFHQLLHWHHFYDRSTSAAGLVSDGLFHAFGWFATVAALFLLADLRRRRTGWAGGGVAGLLALMTGDPL